MVASSARVLTLKIVGLAVPFLNHIAALKSRSGAAPNIRVGGNTQERMKLMEYPFPNGTIIQKTANPNSANPVCIVLVSHSLGTDGFVIRLLHQTSIYQ